MPIELRWLASTAASSLHAAAATLAGATLVDRATAAAIEDEARGLGEDLAALGLDPARFFEHALAQSVRFDVPRQLAEVVLRKIVGPASLDEAVASPARAAVDGARDRLQRCASPRARRTGAARRAAARAVGGARRRADGRRRPSHASPTCWSSGPT